MNKFLFAVCLIISTASFSQKIQTCYLYSLNSDSHQKFNYTVAIDSSESEYNTTYLIYQDGKVRYKCVATHYKNEQKVVVEVSDQKYFLSDMNNKEEATYDTTTLKPFGFRGNIGALTGKHVPNQLGVKFMSSKFQHVKVLSVLASYADGNFQFFVF